MQSMPSHHVCEGANEGTSDTHEQGLSDLTEEYPYQLQETSAGTESLNIECRRCSDGDKETDESVKSSNETLKHNGSNGGLVGLKHNGGSSGLVGLNIDSVDEAGVGSVVVRDVSSLVRRGATSDYESSESASSAEVDDDEDVSLAHEAALDVPSCTEEEDISLEVRNCDLLCLV